MKSRKLVCISIGSWLLTCAGAWAQTQNPAPRADFPAGPPAAYVSAETPMGTGRFPSILRMDSGLPTHTLYHPVALDRLQGQKLPLVVWGGEMPQQLYCSVGGDNASGGQLATEHLLGLGRKRIAFMGEKSLPEPEKRYSGYQKALRKAGLKTDPSLYIPSSFAPLAAQDALRVHLDRHGLNFDAIVAASDLIAISALGVLRERGYRVPEDVSVVGYDDVDAARHSFPPLSTVHQPLDVAARALLQSLQEVMQGRQPVSRQLNSPLIVRASSHSAR